MAISGCVLFFALLICVSTLERTWVTATQLKRNVRLGIIVAGNDDWLYQAKSMWENIRQVRPAIADCEIEIILIPGDHHGHVLDYSRLTDLRSYIQSKKVDYVIGRKNELISVVADDLKLPYIVTSQPRGRSSESHQYSVNILPSSRMLHAAVKDVVSIYLWKQSAVFYDDEQGLDLIGELMSSSLIVRGWRVHEDIPDALLLDYLLRIRQLSVTNVIVSCRKKLINRILETGLRLSMLSERYSWIIVHMNPQEMSFSEFSYTEVNMTSFSVINASYIGIEGSTFASDIVSAIRHDALQLMALLIENEGNHKDELPRILRKISFQGATGMVDFDDRNERANVTLDIMSMLKDVFTMNGHWKSSVNSYKKNVQFVNQQAPSTGGRNLLGHGVARVVTAIDPPFVMLKKNSEMYEGNDRYEGYLIDLLAAVASRMGFQYEIYESPDGSYGYYDPDTHQWNGMMKELIDGNASMCLAAIAITSEREKVIDFAKPYKDLTFSILMKRPAKKSSIFQFLWPLHEYVWVLTAATVIMIGVALYIIEKCNTTRAMEQRFPFSECIWFVYGSLVGAGTEAVPRTLSSRCLSGAWWFFSLILLSSYTANLAAFLTVTRIETPINSLTDLAAQSDIRYGTVRNTYVAAFFQNSKVEAFKKMWTYMNEIHPDSLMDNSSLGFRKIHEGNFAFLWDSPINRYIEMTQCETMVVGQPFDRKGYGIGVPLGAAYRDALTLALLHINEEGLMQQLERKWWSGGKCEAFEEVSTSGTKELTIYNVAGIFVVLACGVFLSFVICIFEFVILRKRNNLKRDGVKRQTVVIEDNNIHATL